jgi:hypothetical protein
MLAFLIYLPLILLAVAVILLAALFVARSVAALQIIEGTLCISCSISLLGFAYWTWFFRDGLKASFIPSEGLQAWQRFAEGFWVPLAILSAVVSLSVFLYRLRLVRLHGKASNHALEPTASRSNV